MIVSQERTATSADKKQKDLLQARNMITLLKEDHPGDLELAREQLVKRGSSWFKKVEAACLEAGIIL